MEQQEAKEYKRSVLEVIKDKIYDSLIQKGYFKESPKETRRTYINLGTSMFSIGFGITLTYAYLKYGMLGYVSAFLLLTVFLIIISLFSFYVGIIVIFLSFLMLLIFSYLQGEVSLFSFIFSLIIFILFILLGEVSLFSFIFSFIISFILFIFSLILSLILSLEVSLFSFIFSFSVPLLILYLIAFGLIVSLIRSLLVRFFNFAIPPISITNTEDLMISFLSITPAYIFASMITFFFFKMDISNYISNDYGDENVIFILKDILQSPFVNLALGILLSGIIIYFIGRYMAKKTKKGVEVYKRILGFKEFLERVEEDRLKRMIEEDPRKLERMLPYAIVLGVEDKWIGKIRDLVNYVQSWMYFVEDIRDIGRAVSSLEASVNSLSEKIR